MCGLSPGRSTCLRCAQLPAEGEHCAAACTCHVVAHAVACAAHARKACYWPRLHCLPSLCTNSRRLPPCAHPAWLQRSPQPQKTGAPGYQMQHQMIGEGFHENCTKCTQQGAPSSATQGLSRHAFLCRPQLPRLLTSTPNQTLVYRHAAAADGCAHSLLQGACSCCLCLLLACFASAAAILGSAAAIRVFSAAGCPHVRQPAHPWHHVGPCRWSWESSAAGGRPRWAHLSCPTLPSNPTHRWPRLRCPWAR